MVTSQLLRVKKAGAPGKPPKVTSNYLTCLEPDFILGSGVRQQAVSDNDLDHMSISGERPQANDGHLRPLYLQGRPLQIWLHASLKRYVILSMNIDSYI